MLFWRGMCYNNLSQCSKWQKFSQKMKTFPFSVRRVHCHTQASTLRWRHNDHAGVSNHQPHGCLLNRLFRRKSKKTSKLRVTGLCVGNSPGTRTNGQLRGKCFHLMTSSCRWLGYANFLYFLWYLWEEVLFINNYIHCWSHVTRLGFLWTLWNIIS